MERKLAFFGGLHSRVDRDVFVGDRLKRFLGAAMMAASACCLAGSARAAGCDPTLKTALEARYAAMKIAMTAHDAPALRAILAPGFSSLDTMGQRQNADQMIAEVTQAQKSPPDRHQTSTSTVLSCSGSTKGLIVKQRYDMKTVKPGPDGASHRVELVSLSTDSWVKPGAQWLIQKTFTDDMTLYRDGKLTAHRARMQ
jgi:hypothetical protein